MKYIRALITSIVLTACTISFGGVTASMAANDGAITADQLYTSCMSTAYDSLMRWYQSLTRDTEHLLSHSSVSALLENDDTLEELREFTSVRDAIASYIVLHDTHHSLARLEQLDAITDTLFQTLQKDAIGTLDEVLQPSPRQALASTGRIERILAAASAQCIVAYYQSQQPTSTVLQAVRGASKRLLTEFSGIFKTDTQLQPALRALNTLVARAERLLKK